jgi:hypothetical protein
VQRLANEVHYFAEVIGKFAATDAPPWLIFPNSPCGTADAFFRLCGGMTRDQNAALLVPCSSADLEGVVRNL